MLYFSKWKTILILAGICLGFLLAMPNVIPEKHRANMPAPLQRTLNLGLDLQGGAHMLLEVDVSSVLAQALENERETIRQAFSEAGRIRTDYLRVEDNAVIGKIRKADDITPAFKALDETSTAIDPSALNSGKTTKIERTSDSTFRVTITSDNIDAIKKRTIAPVSYTHLTLPTKA